MAAVSETGPAGLRLGSLLLRRVLPAVVSITAATGWLRWYASDRGLISHGVGVVLMTGLSIVAFGTLAVWSARKLTAAEALRRRADRDDLYRRLARNYPNGGTFLFDRELRYVLVEGSNLQEVGLTREGMEGRLISEVLTPNELATIEPVYRAALGGETTTFEMEYRQQHYRVTVAPTWDDREIVGGVAMTQRITDEKNLRDQVVQLQKMEAIGQLAGGVAHDFNNLLLAIRGYCELARTNAQDDRAGGWLDEVLKASDRAAALTKQLLAFSRKQVQQLEPVNLNTAIADTEAMLDRLLSEQIEIVTVLDPELACAEVDPGHINQVLVNLAVNARDAMPSGGRLTIETKNVTLDEAYAREHLGAEPGNYVMLAVSDTGVGMDRELCAQIFDPFFTTKPEGHGTGLGLSTVYGIVTQSNGYISVYSEPGWGTVFRVYLPHAAGEAGPAALPAEPAFDRTGGRILVVDDDDGVRGVIAAMLSEHGYDADLVADADAARELYERVDYDLLLTDVVVASASGREVAEHVTALQPEISVLYMSGYMPHTVEQSLPADARFLPKPFTTRELVGAVAEALQRAA